MLGACFHLVSVEKNNIKIKNTTNLLLCDFYPQIRTVSGKLTAVMKCLLSCFVRPWLLSQHFTCLQRELEVFVVGLDRQPLRNCPHSSCGLHLSHWCSTPATAASVVSQVYMFLTDIITANSNVSIQQSWDTREHLVMLRLPAGGDRPLKPAALIHSGLWRLQRHQQNLFITPNCIIVIFISSILWCCWASMQLKQSTNK